MRRIQKRRASYLWDPSADLFEEIKKDLQEGWPSSGEKVKIEDHSKGMDRLKQRIREAMEETRIPDREDPVLKETAIPLSPDLLSIAREGRFLRSHREGVKESDLSKSR